MEDNDGLTASGDLLGTPSYMAPEQASGRNDRVDQRTDVYALGAVLTGRPPFQAASLTDTLRQVIDAEPAGVRVLNPTVPRDLETICLKCLEKEPANRYPSTAEFGADLRRWLANEPIRARRVGPLERGWRWCVRRPLAAGLAAAVLLIALLAFVGARFAGDAMRVRELAQLQSHFDAELDRPEYNAEYLQAREAMAKEIEHRAGDVSGKQRARLYDKFANAIQSGLVESRLSDEAAATLQAAVDSLRERRPAVAQDLETQLKRKLNAWREVARLQAPFSGAATIFPDRELVATAAGVKTKSATQTLVAATDGKTRWEATVRFDEAWETVGELGVAFVADAKTGYAFRVGAKPPAVADVKGAEIPIRFDAIRKARGVIGVEIVRNGIPVSVQEFAAEAVRSRPLRLRARRYDDRLSLQINDLKATEFRDIFPLQRPTTLRTEVLLPESVALTEFVTRRQQAPAAASPLERGDAAYSAGDLSAALDFYQQQEQTAGIDAIRQECRYKQGYKAAFLQTGCELLDDRVAALGRRGVSRLLPASNTFEHSPRGGQVIGALVEFIADILRYERGSGRPCASTSTIDFRFPLKQLDRARCHGNYFPMHRSRLRLVSAACRRVGSNDGTF